MHDEQARMVICDPAHNLRIDGNVSGQGEASHNDFAIASGEMIDSEFTRFVVAAISLLASNSASGSLHFIFMDWNELCPLLPAALNVYRQFIADLIRVRPLSCGLIKALGSGG